MEIKPDYQKAEKRASDILEEYGIKKPIIPIFDIARNKGLIIKFVKMPQNLVSVAGFLDNNNKIIYVNADDAPNRQTFTVAHELGHYILDHKANEYEVLLRLPSVKTTPVEKEANCFAAAILVPREMLKSAMKEYSLSNKEIDLLATMFGVSSKTMEFRLNHI
jgi:Zn-dependent peptidase ImmA (M78 family)